MGNAAPATESTPAPQVMSRLTFPRAAWNGVWITIVGLLVYYALFRLPFSFPPHQRLMSASYAFGFNNGVAILAMTGMLGLVTLLSLVIRRRAAIELPISFPKKRDREAKRSERLEFAIAAACYTGLTLAMYIYNVRSAPALMWETRHLLHRTWLMDLYGLHPYTEVAAEYGPILTYAPSFTYWLLKPLGASHELAYFACHLLLNLGGLWCAYYVLSRANMPSCARVVSFILVAIAGFGPWMGVNGVLIRYLFPFAALLLGHRVITLVFSRLRSIAWWGGAVASILLLLVGNILLSPEIGIAFALAWFGYAVLMSRRDLRILPVSLIAFAAAALLCWLFLPAAYYGTLLRFSEGANNLPLLPAPHLLLYILTLFILVPQLLAASVKGPQLSDVGDASICGALGILCIVMAPGALGRCDPPHALLYGMGVSMLLMIRLANISRRAFAAYAISYGLVFIFLIDVVNLLVFYGVGPKTVISRHPLRNLAQRFRYAADTSHPDAKTLSALDRYPRLGLPFASFGDAAVEKYVVTSGKLDPEYYVAIVGVYSPAALERKLRDVGRAEYLLVPKFLRDDGSPPNPCGAYLKGLRQWFLYPASLPCRADPLDPLASVKSFIAGHYVPVEQVGSWSVLRRISSSPEADLPF